MSAVLLGPAPGGHFLQFTEHGDLECDVSDPITLDSYVEGQILYRFGERQHNNSVCFWSFLCWVTVNHRHPITNTPYTEDVLREFEEFATALRNTPNDQWHATAYALVYAHVARHNAWDGHTLHWPSMCTIVHPETDFFGEKLKQCTLLIIPSSVTSIAFGACETNTCLQRVIFESGSQLTCIGDRAFKETSIERFDVQPLVTVIGSYAFAASRLTQLRFLGEHVHEIGVSAFEETQLTQFTVPKQLRMISAELFLKCTQLMSVTFPRGCCVKKIGGWAFAETALKTIDLPHSVKALQMFAFSGCTRLQRVSFASDSLLQRIGMYAFKQTSLVSFTCPPTVTEIGKGAFADCCQLKTIQLSPQLQLLSEALFMGSGLETFFVSPNIEHIDCDVFNNCQSLKTIILGETLKTIGTRAFLSTPLVEVVVPDTVVTIYKDAFKNCSSLCRVRFGSDSQLRVIFQYAFAATGLTAVHLPANVELLYEGCFADNRALKKFTIATGSKLRNIEQDIVTNTSVLYIEGVPAAAFVKPSRIHLEVEFKKV